MSCQHGNHVDDCDLCTELLSEYRSGVEIGKKDGWEACESCHGIVDGKHVELESLRQQLAALTMQCEKLVKWKHLMSYNDSYFGEHAGDLKRVVYEIDRSMPIRGDK